MIRHIIVTISIIFEIEGCQEKLLNPSKWPTKKYYPFILGGPNFTTVYFQVSTYMHTSYICIFLNTEI